MLFCGKIYALAAGEKIWDGGFNAEEFLYPSDSSKETQFRKESQPFQHIGKRRMHICNGHHTFHDVFLL